MTRRAFAMLAVLVGATLGCSSGEEVERPEACDLSGVGIVPSGSVAPSDGSPEVARVSTFSAMSERAPITWLVVWPDGRVEARAEVPTPEEVRHAVISRSEGEVRHAAIDRAGVERLQRCVDDSGFLALDEGTHSPGVGPSGDRFCGVADAATTTVVARGSDGGARTVSADALNLPGGWCEPDRPEALTIVYDALDQLREQVAAVGAR